MKPGTKIKIGPDGPRARIGAVGVVVSNPPGYSPPKGCVMVNVGWPDHPPHEKPYRFPIHPDKLEVIEDEDDK